MVFTYFSIITITEAIPYISTSPYLIVLRVQILEQDIKTKS